MAKLERELKKKHPFSSAEQEATLNLLRTSDQIQIRFSRLFREHGLTAPQYNILRILRGENGPMPILEIARRTVTVVPGITGLIDRLEGADLVRRERSADDRRVIYAVLTDKARELLARLDEPVLDLHDSLLGHLTRAELAELGRLLDKVREPLIAEE